MMIEFKYQGQSGIVQGLHDSRVSLATNALREAAFFRGTLGRPLPLREALGALSDVVRSNFKFQARDRVAFKAWLAEQDRRFVAQLAVKSEKARVRMEELEIEKAKLEDARELRMAPFYAARKNYFEYVFHHQYELQYLLDPVITVHPDELFFEAFSKDESSYGRIGVRYDLFSKIDSFECGTTNIDFSARLAMQLDRMRNYRPARFDVGASGFAVTVGAEPEHKEKKIALPETWVQGFLQVQSTMTMGLTALQIAPVDLFNIVRFLKLKKARTSPRALRYELVPGQRPKVVFEPWETAYTLDASPIYTGDKPQSIRTWGRDRLKLLARMIPMAENVTVYLAGFGLPTIYVLNLDCVSFTLALSGWTDNDWAGGAKFELLTRRLNGTAQELINVYEALRSKRHASDVEIATLTGLDKERTRSALSHLCQVGRAMFDLSTKSYRHRDLFPTPFTLQDAQQAVKPAIAEKGKTAEAARVIQEKENIRIIMRRPTSTGFKLSGSARGEKGDRVRPLLTVNKEGDIVDGTCTCGFFKSHKLTKGPCEHLLALRLAHMDRLKKGE